MPRQGSGECSRNQTAAISYLTIAVFLEAMLSNAREMKQDSRLCGRSIKEKGVSQHYRPDPEVFRQKPQSFHPQMVPRLKHSRAGSDDAEEANPAALSLEQAT